MKDITDRLADGEYTSYEAARQLALAQSMEKELKRQIEALKDFLTEKMDAKEHLTTEIGTVAAKHGSEPRWKVKDAVAFAQWLETHGEESSVEQVPYPVEWATKPDAIEHLIGQHGGEQPAGVELSRGTGDTVAVSKVKEWSQIFNDQKAQSQARQLLGITSGDSAGDEDGKAEEYWA
ncbi:hypothetical protein [Bifidobacterium asteroides]|uniref:Phage protein n=1 Tax=Bifidobacterium asteroides TaxID=1684 RepID=A0A6N7TSR1_9BIFI|nr:hypothetical protein [Bifidobacterium asteroides]MSD90196.1 hypothetical protein [Bifidobacterium asteroides]